MVMVRITSPMVTVAKDTCIQTQEAGFWNEHFSKWQRDMWRVGS